MEQEKGEARAYEVTLQDGTLVLSETTYHILLHRGLTEEQIKMSLDVLSAHLIEKGLKSIESVNPQVISY